MGMMQELGLEVVESRRSHRAIAGMAGSRPGAWAMSKLLRPIDEIVYKRSNGRTTASSSLAGLPIVMISTTGAKSGHARTTPLTAIPIGDNVALLGTNFGQTTTPGWVYNLEANPEGTAACGEVSISFTARSANQAEHAEVLASAGRIYSGYDKYRDRVKERAIRVFILEPTL